MGTSPTVNPLGDQLFQARLKANDFVQEHLKTIVTIASGTLVLTVSFVKDVVAPGGPAVHAPWLLSLSWLALGLAVLFGTVGLAVLVNNVDDAALTSGGDFQKDEFGVPVAFAAGKDPAILRWERLSLGPFVLGIFALAVFGASNYSLFLRRKPEPEKKTEVQTVKKEPALRYTMISTPEHRTGLKTRDSHTFLLDQTGGQVWQMVCVKGHLVRFTKTAVEGLPESPSR